MFRARFAANIPNKLKIERLVRRFAGYTPKQIQQFFTNIKENLLRPKETEFHARNKLLLLGDRNHSTQYWHTTANRYQIGISTAKGFIKDVGRTIFKTTGPNKF